jgi:hypothetical protein
LRSGHVREGLSGLDGALEELGVHAPRSSGLGSAALVAHRAYLRLGGLRYRLRPASELSPAKLQGVDALADAAEGSVWLDSARSARLLTRMVHRALAAGEPRRLVKALAAEAYRRALRGPRARAGTGRVFGRARSLADQLDSSYLDAYLDGVGAMIAHGESRFGEVAQLAAAAVGKLERCERATHWEIMTVRLFGLWGQMLAGSTRVAVSAARELLTAADEREDRWLASTLRLLIAQHAAPIDDSEVREHLAAAERTLEPWGDHMFGFLRYNWLCASAQAMLHDGDGPGALALFERYRRDVRRSGLLRVQVLRVGLRRSQGAAHLLAYDRDGHGFHLRSAARAARALRRERIGWAIAEGCSLEAGLQIRHGRVELAARALERAASDFAACGVLGGHHRALWQRGRLVGGAEGAELAAKAEQFFARDQLGLTLGVMRGAGHPDELP